jgi:phosphosulfolactate synthase
MPQYNFNLSHIPSRDDKPRKKGQTMVMDKGIGIRQAEEYMDCCGELIDFIKLGFGTSFITKNLKEKIKLYHKNGIKVYLGGTLFEAFIIRNAFEDYLRLLDELKLDTAEVSDGSLVMPHDQKCEYIDKLSKSRYVLSEVGSKEEGIIIHPAKWIKMMKTELESGASKVIAEARESGNVGIFHRNGSAHVMLINRIISKIDRNDILWETPQKAQQVYFIKMLGAEVNVGNISFDDVIPLETLRLGLRGDTFFTFLPDNLKTIEI